MITILNTEDLLKKLGGADVVLVDVRTSAAFNGWKLKGEARGGHIRGAVSFPTSWLESLSEANVKMLLDSKGVTRDKTVLVYGYQGEVLDSIVNLLRKLSYEKICIYEPGLEEWAGSPHLPMDHLAHYEKLVHPQWVNTLIHGMDAQTFRGKCYLVVEVGTGKPVEYRLGHIPGAIYLDLSAFEREPSWNVVSDLELEMGLLSHGINSSKTIVLFGRDTLAAARAALILMYAGVEDVRLLDGGIGAWKDAGLELETDFHQPLPAKDFGRPVPAHPEFIIDMDGVNEIFAANDALLVSVRSWDEYTGKTSGYEFIKLKGRIAGAIWAGLAGSDAYHMEGYRNPDNTMRDYHEISAIWEGHGVTADKKVAFYCGTGWRASEAFFYAYLMGWKDICVYDGGWLEWSAEQNNPIEKGR